MPEIKNDITVLIPPSINGDLDGLLFMAKCLNDSCNTCGKLVFDFKNNTHFDVSLTAVLGIIVKTLNEQGTACTLSNVNQELREVWGQNGFLSYFMNLRAIGLKKSKMKDVEKYLEVRKEDLHEVADYIENEFLSANEFPKISESLRKEMTQSILELIINAHQHGNSEYAVCCGHISHADSKLCFCVTNVGKTFKDNIYGYLRGNLPNKYPNHIEWAMDGNTTKTDQVGGLGLRLLKEFVEKNKGRIQIHSDEEYWMHDYDGTNCENMTEKIKMMGTVVYIEINLQDEKTYYLTSETRSNNNGGK